MAFVQTGIKEVFIDDATAVVKATAIGMGVRNNGTFIAEQINEMRDKDNRLFPSMINFRAEISTMQLENDALWDMLIAGAKQNALSAIIFTSGLVDTSGVITSPTGGAYLFNQSASNGLGVDFELSFTQNERLVNLTLERAYKFDDTSPLAAGSANKIIEDAATDSLDLSAETDKLPEIVPANVPTGFINPADMTNLVPAGLSTAFGDQFLDEFQLTIRTVGNKSGFNITRIRTIEVDFQITASGPDAAGLLTVMEHAFNSADISVTFGTHVLKFKANGLTQYGSFNLGDEARTMTLLYSGSYDIDFVDVSVADETTFKTYFI